MPISELLLLSLSLLIILKLNYYLILSNALSQILDASKYTSIKLVSIFSIYSSYFGI